MSDLTWTCWVDSALRRRFGENIDASRYVDSLKKTLGYQVAFKQFHAPVQATERVIEMLLDRATMEMRNGFEVARSEAR